MKISLNPETESLGPSKGAKASRTHSSACFAAHCASASHLQDFHLLFEGLQIPSHHLLDHIFGPAVWPVFFLSLLPSWLSSSFPFDCSLPVSWFFQLHIHLAFVCPGLDSRTQCRHLLQQIIVLMLFCSTPLRFRPCQLSPIRLPRWVVRRTTWSLTFKNCFHSRRPAAVVLPVHRPHLSPRPTSSQYDTPFLWSRPHAVHCSGKVNLLNLHLCQCSRLPPRLHQACSSLISHVDFSVVFQIRRGRRGVSQVSKDLSRTSP